MTVTFENVNGVITAKPVGRVDSNTAPVLEQEIDTNIVNPTKVIMDLEKLEYISSAGLRLLLKLQKTLNSTKTPMVVTNVAPEVKEVFDITGFADILTIE